MNQPSSRQGTLSGGPGKGLTAPLDGPGKMDFDRWHGGCVYGSMTITINYKPLASPGYTPRPSLTLHNVAAVYDKGVHMVEVWMLFTDPRITHDHVVSVVVLPERAS